MAPTTGGTATTGTGTNQPGGTVTSPATWGKGHFPFPPNTQIVPVSTPQQPVVHQRPVTEVLGEKIVRHTPAPVQVAPAAVAASTLPFTGASHTGTLIGSGIGSLLAGAMLVLLGRKRRTA